MKSQESVYPRCWKGKRFALEHTLYSQESTGVSEYEEEEEDLEKQMRQHFLFPLKLDGLTKLGGCKRKKHTPVCLHYTVLRFWAPNVWRFSPHQAILPHLLGVLQFSSFLIPGVSIRSHMLRAQSQKTFPAALSDTNLKSRLLSSVLLGINWRFT